MAAATACTADAADAAAVSARRWQMRRNCALAPQQVLAMYGALCALQLPIGGAFWLLGFPAVALWASIELTGIACALLCYARHAADRETLVLAHGQLLVEQCSGGDVQRASFDAAWVRVACSSGPHARVTLSQRGRRVDIGCHLQAHQCSVLARDLRLALRTGAG